MPRSRKVYSFACEACGQRYNDFGRHTLRDCPGRTVWLEPYIPAPSAAPLSDVTAMESNVAKRMQKDALRDTIASDLMDMRFEHGITETQMRFIKSCASKWLREVEESYAERLAPFLKDGVAADTVVADALHTALFDGLQTFKQEKANARSDVPYLEPRIAHLSPTDTVASFDVADLLIRHLNYSKRARQLSWQQSERWKQGDLHYVMPHSQLRNFDDGVVARFHAELMKKAGPEEVDDFRIGLALNCDDIEVRVLFSAPHVPAPLRYLCSLTRSRALTRSLTCVFAHSLARARVCARGRARARGHTVCVCTHLSA